MDEVARVKRSQLRRRPVHHRGHDIIPATEHALLPEAEDAVLDSAIGHRDLATASLFPSGPMEPLAHPASRVTADRTTSRDKGSRSAICAVHRLAAHATRHRNGNRATHVLGVMSPRTVGVGYSRTSSTGGQEFTGGTERVRPLTAEWQPLPARSLAPLVPWPPSSSYIPPPPRAIAGRQCPHASTPPCDR